MGVARDDAVCLGDAFFENVFLKMCKLSKVQSGSNPHFFSCSLLPIENYRELYLNRDIFLYLKIYR
jgi:hypothetical protein